MARGQERHADSTRSEYQPRKRISHREGDAGGVAS